jgi:hypothetical protein
VIELLFQNSNRRNTQVFSDGWFQLWQIPLLTAINCIPVLKDDLRQALGIPGSYDRAWITKLLPSCFHCYNGHGKRIAVFYSRRPLADNLRRNWADLWKLFHSWDINYANKIPALSWANIGFDTLVPSPQASHGGTNITCCGILFADANSSDTDWSTLRSGGNGTSINIRFDQSYIVIGDVVASSIQDYWQDIMRGFFSFDTSSLGSSSTILSGNIGFTLYTVSKADLGTPNSILVSSNQTNANDLITSDWNTVGTTALSNPFIPSGMTQSLTDAGLAYLNKIGITKFATIDTTDWNNSPYTWVDSGESGILVNDSTGSGKPTLTIIYIKPAAGRKQKVSEDD